MATSQNKTEERAAYTFSVPKDVRPSVKSLQNAYGYRREADAALNLMKVGLIIYQRNPNEFLALLAKHNS